MRPSRPSTRQIYCHGRTRWPARHVRHVVGGRADYVRLVMPTSVRGGDHGKPREPAASARAPAAPAAAAQETPMPTIDVYPPKGTFADLHELAQLLAAAVNLSYQMTLIAL